MSGSTLYVLALKERRPDPIYCVMGTNLICDIIYYNVLELRMSEKSVYIRSMMSRVSSSLDCTK